MTGVMIIEMGGYRESNYLVFGGEIFVDLVAIKLTR